jgi:ribosomal protein S7
MVKIIELKKKNPYFILSNKLIHKGMKCTAYRRCLYLLEYLKIYISRNNEQIFKLIFSLLEVYVYIYRKKIGGNIHSIPLCLNKNVRLKKGLSNFLKVLENKKDRTFNERILKEMIDIFYVKGSTLSLRNNVYMTAAEEKSNLRFIRPKVKRAPINYKELYLEE